MRVSIRARHCCRANQPTTKRCQADRMFQSAPGIAAGRIATSPAFVPSAPCFNPRPALLPGESCLQYQSSECDDWVSIRARHCCRANPLGRPCWRVSLGCFNPRPALLPGESSSWPLPCRRAAVSIRARHCCRANHRCCCLAAHRVRFQSAPGIAAGRIWHRSMSMRQSRCFNPRPALLPGESP